MSCTQPGDSPTQEQKSSDILFHSLPKENVNMAEPAREAACLQAQTQLINEVLRDPGRQARLLPHDPSRQRRLSLRGIYAPRRLVPTSSPNDPVPRASTPSAYPSAMRRWEGKRAQACELADLPEELYSLIVHHVECPALAPFALVSTSWSATCRKHFVSGEFWERRAQIQKHARLLIDHAGVWSELHVWSESALRLLGALACRCSEPAELVKLLHAAQQSEWPAPGWDSNFVEGLVWQCGPIELGPQLVKCGRLEDWTKERVLEVTLLYLDLDDFNAAQSLDAAGHLADVATALISSMRTSSALGRGFVLTMQEVFALFLTRVNSRENRSWMIMAKFAVFVENFVFGDVEAAEIGCFAAFAQLPIDDMCAVPRSSGLMHHLPTTDLCAHLVTQHRPDLQAWTRGGAGVRCRDFDLARARCDVCDPRKLGRRLELSIRVARGGRARLHARAVHARGGVGRRLPSRNQPHTPGLDAVTRRGE